VLCDPSAGIQGTSSSTLYHVLLDQNNMSMDDLQGFTNK